MAVIAVYSVKGGVGKTTIAANLAWCSATISRRRTLLWDLDPAGGAAFLFGVDANDTDRAARLFAGKGGAAEVLDLPASTLRSRMKKLGIERSA